jgi:hypothetical protein
MASRQRGVAVVHSASGGQRLRCARARALAMRTRSKILEPPAAQPGCRQAWRRLQQLLNEQQGPVCGPSVPRAATQARTQRAHAATTCLEPSRRPPRLRHGALRGSTLAAARPLQRSCRLPRGSAPAARRWRHSCGARCAQRAPVCRRLLAQRGVARRAARRASASAKHQAARSLPPKSAKRAPAAARASAQRRPPPPRCAAAHARVSVPLQRADASAPGRPQPGCDAFNRAAQACARWGSRRRVAAESAATQQLPRWTRARSSEGCAAQRTAQGRAQPAQ